MHVVRDEERGEVQEEGDQCEDHRDGVLVLPLSSPGGG